MDSKTQAANTHQASATLYQLLSLAWSYPGAELFEALKTGEFMSTVNQSLIDMRQSEKLESTSVALQAGIKHYIESHQQLDLETDYVSLFENNIDAPVVHLYQHLYVEDDRSQVEVLKSLTRRYQRLGIALKQNEGVEQPDHLSIQLECMAYCYIRLTQALSNGDTSAAEFYCDEIRQLEHELVWLENFARRLHGISEHPFYLPLTDFSRVLLSNTDNHT